MEKTINYKCICKKSLPSLFTSQIMLLPCEHVLHKTCHNKKDTCDICNVNITDILTICDAAKTKNTLIGYQRYVDMIALSPYDMPSNNDIDKNYFFSGMTNLMSIVMSIPFYKGIDGGTQVVDDTMKMLNAKIIINGIENIPENKKAVIISNHKSFLDFMVLFKIFKAGFLASSFIEKSFFGRMFLNYIPLLIIERGKSEGTVEKMKDYVNEHGSICIFPEGVITHPKVIGRFRTGCFYTGHPVVPVVIKYNPAIYYDHVNDTVKKIISLPEITINVNVLKMQYPPFDKNKIENVRRKMAKAGNLCTSRISNRDIDDKQN